MNIRTTTEGFELTNAITNYVGKKITSFGKHLRGLEDVTIEIILKKNTKIKKGQGFQAEINIRNGKQRVINAQSKDNDLYVAIDKVKDGLILELEKKTSKKRTKSRKDAARVKRQIKAL